MNSLKETIKIISKQYIHCVAKIKTGLYVETQKIFKHHPISKNSHDKDKNFNTLVNDGILILPNYWDSQITKKYA